MESQQSEQDESTMAKEANLIVEGVEDARAFLLAHYEKILEDPSDDVDILLARDARTGEVRICDLVYDWTTSFENLVDRIIAKAEEDALEQARTKLRYVVRYAARIKTLSERTVFTLSIIDPDEDEDEDDGDFDDLPNEQSGLTAQMMKHSEMLLESTLNSSTAHRELLSGMLSKLEEENEHLKKQWLESQKIVEELLEKRLERQKIVEELLEKRLSQAPVKLERRWFGTIIFVLALISLALIVWQPGQAPAIVAITVGCCVGLVLETVLSLK